MGLAFLGPGEGADGAHAVCLGIPQRRELAAGAAALLDAVPIQGATQSPRQALGTPEPDPTHVIRTAVRRSVPRNGLPVESSESDIGASRDGSPGEEGVVRGAEIHRRHDRAVLG